MSDKILRSDGRVEWICEHNIGHTISVPSQHRKDSSWWIHGCDGCCLSQQSFRGVSKE